MSDIIGKNIHALRKKQGLTQEELAGLVNVSFQAVSKWENGCTTQTLHGHDVCHEANDYSFIGENYHEENNFRQGQGCL